MNHSLLFRSFILFVAIFMFGSVLNFAQDNAATSLGFNSKTHFGIVDNDCVGAGSLIYDDGTFENGYGWNPVVTDGRFVQLFTPVQYPWTFSTFCLALTRVAASPTSFTFDIVVYANDGAGGAPGTLVHTITGVTATNIPVWPTLDWYSFSMAGTPDLASGSYFIGIKYDPSIHSAPLYSGADESASTPLHPGYAYSGTDWATIQSLFAGYRAMSYRTMGSSSVGPGPATNPSPSNGATGVPITGTMLSWTNPAGATSNQVFFGTDPGSLTQIHSGSLISSIAAPSPLTYNTTYYWRVNEIDGSGTTIGQVWSFVTETDPLIITWCEPFQNLSFWTILGPVGLTNWAANNSANAGGTAPELRMSWTPSFNGESRIRSNVIIFSQPLPNSTQVFYSFNFFLDWYEDPSGTVEVLITWDGGTTTIPLYTLVNPTGNVGPLTVTGDFTSPASGPTNLQVEIVFTGNSFNIDYIYWDDICFEWIIPVELTSFAATTNGHDVVLNWTTASEINNQGFEVERAVNGEFQKIGYVPGYGTTTELMSYSFTDHNLANGTYSYRLKQIDLDGSFAYSDMVEVEVDVPVVFSLAQNYPNPFNPSTTISFGLAVDAKVNLRIFNILGQEIATLINSNITAGNHDVNFDASSLTSGVYFYTIEAKGVDGSTFMNTKKMILTK